MSEAEHESETDESASDEADAVALFRPVRREALTPFLDLDEDSENSDGIYAEALDDGSFLLHTFQPFAVFAEGGDEAHAWLAQFGEALDEVHDDPRGILFFPDTIEPESTTYAGVVKEAEEEGIWLSRGAELAPDELGGGFPPGLAGLDMEALQAIAGQLLGAAPDPKTGMASSFDIAKLLEGMPSQLAKAFGLEPPAPGEADDDDDDDDDDDVIDVPAEPSPDKPAKK